MYFFHCFTELVQTQNLYKYHLRYKSILYHHSIVISFKNLKNQWISVNIPVFVPFLGLFFLYLLVLFYSDMGFVCFFDWLIYWICCCLIIFHYCPLKSWGFFLMIDRTGERSRWKGMERNWGEERKEEWQS